MINTSNTSNSDVPVLILMSLPLQEHFQALGRRPRADQLPGTNVGPAGSTVWGAPPGGGRAGSSRARKVSAFFLMLFL